MRRVILAMVSRIVSSLAWNSGNLADWRGDERRRVNYACESYMSNIALAHSLTDTHTPIHTVTVTLVK